MPVLVNPGDYMMLTKWIVASGYPCPYPWLHGYIDHWTGTWHRSR